MILILCAGLISVSPALALSTASESDADKARTDKSNSPRESIQHESNEITSENARDRLSKLWEATFTHYADLQFVTQKLLGGRVSVSEVQKAISQQGQLGTWALADRDDPGYPKQFVPLSDYRDPRFTFVGGYSSLIRFCSKKGHRISQTEAIMLFDMVRRAADTLSSAYSDYLSSREVVAAAVEANETEQADYLRVKLLVKKQKLIELAGEAAVRELETELETHEADVPLDPKAKESTRTKTQERLENLLEATFTRSADIQFINKKMGGSLSPSKILEFISSGSPRWSIAYSNTPGHPLELVPIANSISTLPVCGLGGGSTKDRKLTQTEMIMLLDMIRRTAETLTSAYSDYSSAWSQLNAETDTPGLEHALDVRKNLVASREKLVNLAGEPAVCELDADLNEDLSSIRNMSRYRALLFRRQSCGFTQDPPEQVL